MEEHTIFEVIKRNILTVVPEVDPNEIALDRSLSDLGCNSIDRAEVVTMTMEDLGITVPIHEFHQGDDIGQLVALMQRHE